MNKLLIIYGVVLLLLASGVTASLSDNTTVYLTFDNDNLTGSTVVDLAGNYNATNTGTTTGETGIINQAFLWGSGDYVNFTSAATIIPTSTNPFTLSFWVYDDDADITTTRTIVALQQSSQFICYLWDNSGTDTLECGFRGGVQATRYVLPGGFHQSWNHMAIIYNGESKSNQDAYTVFINGAEPTKQTSGGIGGSAAYNTIGSQSGSASWNGKIDEFAIIDYNVSNDTVTQLYGDGSGWPWPFIDNSTTVLVTTHNAYTTNPISNFTGTITNRNNASHNYTFTANGTTATIVVTKEYDYTAYVEHPSYSISSANYYNFTANTTVENINFSLYSNNSLLINLYDADTETPITINMSIVISGNLSENTYYTNTSQLFVDNLQDGEYTVSIQSVDENEYALQTYDITVADRSTQTLNAYLSKATSPVTFTLIDFYSGSTIEGVSVTMSRIINDTLTLVSSKNTDITGRVQFQYRSDVKYYFTASKDGYASRSWELDPVTDSAYTVRLTRLITISEEPDFFGVSVYATPSLYYDNQTNNFTFTIASANGTLNAYQLNITYPSGGFKQFNGSNSYGEVFTYSFTINNSLFLDKVDISYWYDTVVDSPRSFTLLYDIVTSSAGSQTWSRQDFGADLPLLDRLMIGTIGTTIIGGAGALIGGLIGGSLMVLLGLSVMGFLGIIPWWASAISMFLGLLFIIGRGLR